MPVINFSAQITSKITRFFCVLTIIGLLNAHIAVMQVWAWAYMLNDRIPEQGLEQAFNTTFSGEYPCEQCKAIAEIKAEETKQSSPHTHTDTEQLAKTIGILSPARSTKIHPTECSRIPFQADHLRAPNDFILAVPSPPPRFV